MRLGLLADIHEEVEHLRASIRELDARGVDRFVLLGDLFSVGRRIDETVEVLAPLDAVGVWGNHDFGLCRDVSDAVRVRYSTRVLDFFARLEPALELGECRFQHIEPHRDAGSLEDLWHYTDGILDTARAFEACPQRLLFMGHVHRWEANTPAGRVAWKGESPLSLVPTERYFLAVHAVALGWSALLDTESNTLEPIFVG